MISQTISTNLEPVVWIQRPPFPFSSVTSCSCLLVSNALRAPSAPPHRQTHCSLTRTSSAFSQQPKWTPSLLLALWAATWAGLHLQLFLLRFLPTERIAGAATKSMFESHKTGGLPTFLSALLSLHCSTDILFFCPSSADTLLLCWRWHRLLCTLKIRTHYLKPKKPLSSESPLFSSYYLIPQGWAQSCGIVW